MRLLDALDLCPLVAILRGVRPDEVVGIATVLEQAGFAIVEVPLNSPEPLDSIARLAETFGARLLIGAGTVTSVSNVEAVRKASGRIVVSPHFDPAVVGAALAAGLDALPGAMTPSEIFAAAALGAKAVKIFPAEIVGPVGLKALRSVLPPALRLLPVGGVSPANMGDYAAAGADGFGIGSALYRPGDTPDSVARQARAFVAAAWASRTRPAR